MSRIGKMPIPVPTGIKIEIKGQDISVSGSKGSLNRTIHPEISVELKGGEILVTGGENDKKINAFRGLMRSLVNNMVVGVDQGFPRFIDVAMTFPLLSWMSSTRKIDSLRGTVRFVPRKCNNYSAV